MKRFVFKVENTAKNPSIYGGRKQKAIVYQIKRGELIKIGETRTWNTASYKGARGEVISWLVGNKIIPKTWSEKVDEKFSITEI